MRMKKKINLQGFENIIESIESKHIIRLTLYLETKVIEYINDNNQRMQFGGLFRDFTDKSVYLELPNGDQVYLGKEL